ncbi:uncharacterized protein LOC141703327 [Apium graveolens]|uniref:uncharacterized protein LOC141703327 n=1 Tax=Apium graveolens TaxID=4045 RepID=UPI003D7C07FC
MGRGKATGPDQIPIEVFLCLGEEGEQWLMRLFDNILRTSDIPQEWRLSMVVPIYKNKGDAHDCSNYRGIKLLSHTMKLWETVIETRLRSKVEVGWGYTLFSDDLVIIKETRVAVNVTLERWRYILDSNGLQVSLSKTKYLWCNFSNQPNDEGVDILMGDQVLPPKDNFRYLGSVLHKERGIYADVTHRMKSGWLKWRAATGLLCDRRVPFRVKGKFYRVAIRPALLYWSECWALKKAQECRLELAKMRILMWICGRTMLDRLSNGFFRNKLRVAPIPEKVREGRLR